MNNAQLNHFSKTPVNIDIARSVFQRPKRVLTTIETGRLIPLMCEEVLPGDSVELDFSSLIRMATPIHPVMDNAVCDVHFYFVPNRIVWNHWKEFMKENTATAWTPSVTYTIPQITSPINGGDNSTTDGVAGWAVGTIGEYLGIPIKRGGLSVSHLPIRGYIHIWNNYYRDQNTMSPAFVTTGDTTVVGNNSGVRIGTGYTKYQSYGDYIKNGYYVTRANEAAAPLPVCRLHDYFSSVLPQPQKGPSVLMPLGSTAPVISGGNTYFTPEWFKYVYGNYVQPSVGDKYTLGTMGFSAPNTPSVTQAVDLNSDQTLESSTDSLFTHMQVDLSQATAATVNQLRNAFMLQRYYERLARGGSRYFEMIRAFFGVTVPDATVQIPEFLGGKRFPINMTQVAQTSSSDSTSKQGNLAAYSLTTTSDKNVFHKSFTEHGYLFAVMCIRTEHSFSQGIPRHFSRKTFDEFYVPTFANAPEQPVYTKELYADGSSTDDTVFGYQEAWAEYRYSPSQICGEFRPDFAQSLDSYHYGDDYASAPTLSASWMAEPMQNVDRTLAVTNHHPWLCDFLFDMKWVRAMPVYSVPGLLDHH